MQEIALTIMLGGPTLSPLLAFMFSGGYRVEGGTVLALAIATGSVAVAAFIFAFSCHDSWSTGRVVCFTTAQKLFFVSGSVAGMLNTGVMIAVLKGHGRSRKQRVLLSIAAVLTVPTFMPAIFSIGALLILAWWVALGWLIIANPPLRDDQVDPAG
ncbi:MAG: hypothetical protein O2826_06745 [Chloroflexi bacterium]|nr:hypothetical protein [Chloroflexota bacterium]MDA1174201.1 hypothetical protein [Chloroflexota bacterium]